MVDGNELEPPTENEFASDPAPVEVTELAEACIVQVERATKIKLDFSAETLPVLDHYVRIMRKDLGIKDEILALVAAPVGAYFGEVVRRAVPLRWYAPHGDYRLWRLELQNAFVSMNPVGAVMEGLLLQDAEGWSAALSLRAEDEAAAGDAVRNLPDADPEEYYALSSRHEVLTLVAEAIVGRDLASGSVRRFGDRDYGPGRADALAEAIERGRIAN
ncbi:MAG: hypothetical protein NVS3B20_18000 [Polyangiales bacterium]